MKQESGSVLRGKREGVAKIRAAHLHDCLIVQTVRRRTEAVPMINVWFCRLWPWARQRLLQDGRWLEGNNRCILINTRWRLRSSSMRREGGFFAGGLRDSFSIASSTVIEEEPFLGEPALWPAAAAASARERSSARARLPDVMHRLK